MQTVGAPAPTLPTIDEAAAGIAAAHARILEVLRDRVEPLTPAEVAELAGLEDAAEAWLRALRRDVTALVRRKGGDGVAPR